MKDGSYVLARQGEEYVFRQLEFGAEGAYYLKTLQAGQEVIELPDLTAVEGVIIQQGARRRADRKHYS